MYVYIYNIYIYLLFIYLSILKSLKIYNFLKLTVQGSKAVLKIAVLAIM